MRLRLIRVMSSLYLTAANGVTVFRIVLFGFSLFFVTEHELLLASILLLVAWGLDGVDGFVARSMNQESDFGSLLDKVVDRAVIGLGIFALMFSGYLPQKAILLLTKDIGLLPVLTSGRPKRWWVAGLGWQGKMMTFLQGVGVVWLVVRGPYEDIMLITVAILGGVVAYVQMRRAFLCQ